MSCLFPSPSLAFSRQLKTLADEDIAKSKRRTSKIETLMFLYNVSFQHVFIKWFELVDLYDRLKKFSQNFLYLFNSSAFICDLNGLWPTRYASNSPPTFPSHPTRTE